MSAIEGVTERQQEIVDAARKIISSSGIEGLTVREIAHELKITDGALYRHFKSKKEIIILLIDDIERTLLATIASAAQKGADPLSRLQAVLFSHISYAEQRKGLTFLLINEAVGLKDARIRKRMHAVIEQYLMKIRQILQAGVDENVLRKDMDVALAGLAFFGLVQSLVTFWALSGYDFSITRNRMEKLFDIYKEGIRGRQEK